MWTLWQLLVCKPQSASLGVGTPSYRLLFIAHKYEGALFLEADFAVHALSVGHEPWIPRAGRSKEICLMTNPVKEADSRALQMTAVRSASRALASSAKYS